MKKKFNHLKTFVNFELYENDNNDQFMNKQPLDPMYDFDVENVVNITSPKYGFDIIEATFMDRNHKPVKRNILDKYNKKIFTMKDGKIILEVEEEDGDCTYWLI